MRLAVFCGPSLPPEDRVADSRVAYLPPAARHDVINAARAYDVILLIDGVFHHDLAPSPKECYASLAHARMFGASSMGALRAVECEPYGFTPLGAIARWYLREVIDGDDEVAVITNPQHQTALTVPMVNVRHASWLARRNGLLSHVESEMLIEASRDIFYMDRSWGDVIALVPKRARASFETLARDRGDLKRLDARFALRRAMRELRA